MRIVSAVYESAQSQLEAIGAEQFDTVAGTIGTILQTAAVVAIVLTFLNMIIQMRPMELGNFISLIVKLLLIFMFATVWGQFNAVAQAVIQTMDSLAGLMVGGNGTATSLAGAFDEMMTDVGRAANTSLQKLGSWGMGVWIMGALVAGLLGLIGAAAALIMIFSITMITIHIALAPIFIACAIFEATKDYFHKWLQATVSYSLYPVVIGAVLGLIMGFVKSMIDRTAAMDIAIMADFVPFIVILLMMVASILIIPMIVSALSGNIMAISPMATIGVGRMMATNAMFAKQTGGKMMAGAAGVAGAASAKAQEYGSMTANSVRGWNANSVQRSMDRAKKYN